MRCKHLAWAGLDGTPDSVYLSLRARRNNPSFRPTRMASHSTGGRPVRVGRYAMFAVARTSIFMLSVDATIVAGALPSVGHAPRTRIAWAARTLTKYQLGQGISMPIVGRISDQFGRERVFGGSVCAFTAATVLRTVYFGLRVASPPSPSGRRRRRLSARNYWDDLRSFWC